MKNFIPYIILFLLLMLSIYGIIEGNYYILFAGVGYILLVVYIKNLFNVKNDVIKEIIKVAGIICVFLSIILSLIPSKNIEIALSTILIISILLFTILIAIRLLKR